MSDQDRMQAIAAPHATFADKIRALDGAGFARADIARFLGKRYQHVRNVLEDDTRQGQSGYVLGRADLSGVQAEPKPFERAADERRLIEDRGNGAYRLVVREDGSIMLPRAIAEALNAPPGGVVTARLEGDEFKLISVETGLARARAMLRKYVPPDFDLVGSFLANRRRMWGEEDSDDG